MNNNIAEPIRCPLKERKKSVTKRSSLASLLKDWNQNLQMLTDKDTKIITKYDRTILF